MEYNNNDYFDSNKENPNNAEDLNVEKDSNSDESNNYDEQITHNNEFIQKKIEPGQIFAFFARSLGVFSVFCAAFSVFFGSFICGGLAIVLAFLSKGYNNQMERNAKIGLVTGIVGVVFQIGALIISVYNIINVPEYREKFNTLYEQMYGVPVDDSINDMLDQLGVSELEGEIL